MQKEGFWIDNLQINEWLMQLCLNKFIQIFVDLDIPPTLLVYLNLTLNFVQEKKPEVNSYWGRFCILFSGFYLFLEKFDKFFDLI